MKKAVITLFLLGLFSQLNATIIIVDRNDDLMNNNDGGCDLRDAVNSANFNVAFGDCEVGELNATDFIFLDVDEPIQLNDEIDVLSAVSISPPLFVNDKVKIIAAPNERIFEVHPTSENSNDFQIANVHLQGGNAGKNDGGAIVFYRFQSNNLGDIYIGDCIFEENSADLGGAVAFDDTFASSITITDNVFIQNNARTGGALIAVRATSGEFNLTSNEFIVNSAADEGKGITGGAAYLIDSNDSIYLIQNNQFRGNTSQGSAGALDLRGYTTTQRFILDNNTFLYNEAESYAGALSVGRFANADMFNSTLAYNSGSRGGAVVFFDGRLDILFSTIVHNNATEVGENIYGNGGIGSIRSSIVAYADSGNNCAGNFTSVESSFSSVIDDNSCQFNGPSSVVVDAKLSALDNHVSGFSGFTPLVTSPAIDNVELNECFNYDNTPMQEDQQGNQRPVDSDNDGNIFCDSGAIEAPVYTNQEASAIDDFPDAIDEDTASVMIDVLANDTDIEGDGFIVIGTTQGSHGTVVINNAGENVSYSPDANYCGTDTFIYTITGNDSAIVTMNISCVDDSTMAISDALQITEDDDLTLISVLDNDTDIDGGKITIASVTQPTNGLVINNSNSLSYEPNTDYCTTGEQTDDFTYSLNGTSTTTVSISVICVDDLPVAVSDFASILEDSNPVAINVLNNDTDIDAGPLFIDEFTQAADGQVSSQNSQLIYQGNSDFCHQGNMTDGFTYSLNGGSTTDVNVAITCVNDQPSFSILGDIVAESKILNQSQLLIPNFANNFIYGPSNESSQQVLQFNTTIQSDTADVIQDININNSGELEINFTENAGVAMVLASMQDNGGTDNAGIDTSQEILFYVTFSDGIYSSGFELSCCAREEELIDNLTEKNPDLMTPIYDSNRHTIDFYGYTLELTQGFPDNPSLYNIKQWLNEVSMQIEDE